MEINKNYSQNQFTIIDLHVKQLTHFVLFIFNRYFIVIFIVYFIVLKVILCSTYKNKSNVP